MSAASPNTVMAPPTQTWTVQQYGCWGCRCSMPLSGADWTTLLARNPASSYPICLCLPATVVSPLPQLPLIKVGQPSPVGCAATGDHHCPTSRPACVRAINSERRKTRLRKRLASMSRDIVYEKKVRLVLNTSQKDKRTYVRTKIMTQHTLL